MSLKMSIEINARRYSAAQRHVYAIVLTFCMFESSMGMSKVVSAGAFTYLRGHEV
jgi:hypothetical protein